MSGKVFVPSEWYNKKLAMSPKLSNYQRELIALKEFIIFLEDNNLFMSVIGSGRDTKNSSIYNSNSTDKQHWICDIKLFDGDMFATDLELVCKESMNKVDEIYENQEFAAIVEILTGEPKQLGKYSNIKEKIDLTGFCNALKEVEKAIKIYKLFR